MDQSTVSRRCPKHLALLSPTLKGGSGYCRACGCYVQAADVPMPELDEHVKAKREAEATQAAAPKPKRTAKARKKKGKGRKRATSKRTAAKTPATRKSAEPVMGLEIDFGATSSKPRADLHPRMKAVIDDLKAVCSDPRKLAIGKAVNAMLADLMEQCRQLPDTLPTDPFAVRGDIYAPIPNLGPIRRQARETTIDITIEADGTVRTEERTR